MVSTNSKLWVATNCRETFMSYIPFSLPQIYQFAIASAQAPRFHIQRSIENGRFKEFEPGDKGAPIPTAELQFPLQILRDSDNGLTKSWVANLQFTLLAVWFQFRLRRHLNLHSQHQARPHEEESKVVHAQLQGTGTLNPGTFPRPSFHVFQGTWSWNISTKHYEQTGTVTEANR